MKAHSTSAPNVVARVTYEDIRREFGVRVSNEELCDLATVRQCNRATLSEIATGLFGAGNFQEITGFQVVEIGRDDLATRRRDFAWGVSDIPESMGIELAPAELSFTKFDVERDIVGRLLSRLGHRDFSLSDPNAGGRIESGADVSADIGNPAVGFQVTQYQSDLRADSGSRGSRLRAREARRASIGLLTPAFVAPFSIEALVHLVEAKSRKGWSQTEFPDMRLVIAASVPQLGGTISTWLSQPRLDEINSQLSPILTQTRYSTAYLYAIMQGDVYQWTRESAWIKVTP